MNVMLMSYNMKTAGSKHDFIFLHRMDVINMTTKFPLIYALENAVWTVVHW